MNNDELLKTVKEKAEKWLGPQYDEETRKVVKEMLEAEDKTPLIDAFYKDLEFGTGGLRGIMGAGSNRMNIYTVGAATQGLANYLNDCFKELPQITVAIGHDVRNNSRKFAELATVICKRDQGVSFRRLPTGAGSVLRYPQTRMPERSNGNCKPQPEGI